LFESPWGYLPKSSAALNTTAILRDIRILAAVFLFRSFFVATFRKARLLPSRWPRRRFPALQVSERGQFASPCHASGDTGTVRAI
jgi:hypothetical protein